MNCSISQTHSNSQKKFLLTTSTSSAALRHWHSPAPGLPLLAANLTFQPVTIALSHQFLRYSTTLLPFLMNTGNTSTLIPTISSPLQALNNMPTLYTTVGPRYNMFGGSLTVQCSLSVAHPTTSTRYTMDTSTTMDSSIKQLLRTPVGVTRAIS